ncbi:hypothetical protein BH09BAC6_BH09BAC6_10320 [soil metagenome]|jgi:hypothetical protein
MNGISPWVAAAVDIFNDQDLPNIYHKTFNSYHFTVHNTGQALWAHVQWPKGGRIVVRLAYAPNDSLRVQKIDQGEEEVSFRLKAIMGEYVVKLSFLQQDQPVFRYTTTVKASKPLLMPFWPRDIVSLGRDGSGQIAEGKVHVNQIGTRSGLVYFSIAKPKTGSVLYMQNLTALNDYCQYTENSAGNVVGGQWPELGFALPPTKDKPLPAGKEVVISDAFIALSDTAPADEFGLAKQFLDMLANIYLQLPLPGTAVNKWPQILDQGLDDLQYNHACWSHADGHSYLNAYVADYDTPPELMVQLAVLLPLLDYKKWSKLKLPVTEDIKDGLDAFYDKKLGTVVRWLPAKAGDLDGSEEQLKPNVMDSWYLHHPMLNLSRLALQGDQNAKKLFLDSIDFTIKVAHHFKYEWPVFYNMETLDVIKAETQPGKGGQHDVAGLYAAVMLQAWELTKENRFLEEAKKAAKKLQGLGFELFYQANNTAFSAKAMLRLYQLTKDELYLDLSYLCIANMFKNFQLWECRYGYAKHYPTFFGVFPLNDAPYTAAYEEQEVFAAFHAYLLLAEGLPILPSIKLLAAEFIRYVVHRAAYYYPPNLPKEMLSDEVKMGSVDPNLWIALEDLHDGWEKSGEVGQEVYGAGVAFGIVPRHYYAVPGEDFSICVDYPTDGFTCRKGSLVSFTVKGDERLTCRMLICPNNGKPLPAFAITCLGADKVSNIEPKRNKDGSVEYTIHGDQKIQVRWGKAQHQPKTRKINHQAKQKAA